MAPSQSSAVPANFWVVRAGAGGVYVDDFVRERYVAIGWQELGRQLTEFATQEDLRTALGAVLPGATPTSLSITAGQLWRFGHEFAAGDVVLTVDPGKRRIYAGRLRGDYSFVAGGDARCPFEHRRETTWSHTFDRDELSVKLKYALGSLMTVFNVNHHQRELGALLEMEPVKPAKQGPSIAELLRQTRETILSRIMDMGGEQFEAFVRHVLDIVGFEQTSQTPYAGDHGVDVVGVLNAKSLASINLKVQVKRQSGSVGISTVNALRGTLAYEEHGLIITTARFTPSARQAAEAPGLKAIALVDGEGLVDLITDVYDDLDEEYQSLLSLQHVLIAAPRSAGDGG